ncbi:SusC/RagA family TonB-linked outer membrane protein [Alistipes sp.]|uniref:SusC/RagA family TonB-linked outer membrane protein n=1 Tax=Alistipes sp. TaxID=1872444 RepID=UPI003AB85E52
MVRKVVLSLIAVWGICALAMAQNRQVSGTVTGVDGTPVAGATVVVEGTATGTTTGTDGRFSVTAPADATLAFTFIGYEPLKVAVAGRTNIDVTMSEDMHAIDDVIVVAFGTAKKEAFTGSAAVIKANDIVSAQVSNPINAMQGKVSGVQIANASGQPGMGGSDPEVRIRGFSSISAGKSPLIILDGIPYDGNLNHINPSDIESMTVLKDAASNALYGARGANGVIMITTKKGKSGDAQVNVDMKWGVNQRGIQSYDYIKDPKTYYETHYKSLYNYFANNQGMSAADAHKNANANIINGKSMGLGYQIYNVPAGQDFIGTDGRVNPAATLGNVVNGNYLTPDNWTDAAFRNTLRQEYNVSISGGTERAQVYASFGYLNNKGITENSDYTRYSARLKADYQAKKWLKVGGNVGYTNYDGNSTGADGQDNSTGNVFAYTTSIAPIYPLYVRDAEGNIMHDDNGYTVYDYGKGENGGAKRGFTGNALADNHFNKSNYNGNAFNVNGYFDVTFLKDFTFTFNAGANLDERRNTSMSNQFYGASADIGGSIYKTHTRKFGVNLQQLLNYRKTIGDHTLSVMVGHENYQYKYSYLTGNKKQLFSPDNDELAGAVVSGSADSYTADYNTEGYFGRVQYDFKEKIFLSGSYRRDASSSFHPDNRWGNFWSLGAAWLITREPFMDGTRNWLDMLKVKASYGTQGNDNLVASRRYNLYTDIYTIVNSNDQVSVTFDTKGNKEITWEKNGNFNVGAEFEVLRSRITGSVEYFYRKTSDMLFFFSVPASLGYMGYYSNIGNMVNKGAELELNFTPVINKKVRWDINLNVTWLTNEITSLPASKRTEITEYENVGGYGTSEWFIGQGIPLYSWYLPKYAGPDPDSGVSRWYVYDKQTGETTTTTTYNDATKYLCGSAIPDAYGGFGTSVEFFGFDFAVQFAYQIGGKGYDGGYSNSMYGLQGTGGNNWHRDMLKAWTPENRSSDIPRQQYADQNVTNWSDRFLLDASYLSLQNINFGYTLPKKWTGKFGVDKLRIYLSCENVWFWSHRKGYDPRGTFGTTAMADIGQINGAYYSPIRTISGGINLTF